MPALLEVKNLRTWFHTRNGIVRAVDGISFHIDKGETLGIVGESGSGKSVSCYSLLRLIPQPPGRIESGQALLGATDLLHCPPEELRQIRGNRVAMIFQDPMTSLNPYMRIKTKSSNRCLSTGALTGKLRWRKRFAHWRKSACPMPAVVFAVIHMSFPGGCASAL